MNETERESDIKSEVERESCKETKSECNTERYWSGSSCSECDQMIC